MEGDEEEHEEDKLGVAQAKLRKSGSVTFASATTQGGKTVAANVLTIGERIVLTQIPLRLRLIKRGKQNRTKLGTLDADKKPQNKLQ